MMNNKKNNLTKVKYQATFLPLISRAETEIKSLIIQSALLLKSKAFLRLRIKQIISRVAEEMPPNIIDRESYIEGLYFSSERMIKKYYDEMVFAYIVVAALLIRNKVIKKMPKNQSELIVIANRYKTATLKYNKPDVKFVKEQAELYKIDMKYEQKASPNVSDYEKRLKEKIGDVAKTEFAPAEEGKKKITVWQKAELDVRHEAQLKMVSDMVEKGVEYAWISSHPDCSVRCSKWQGSLVALNLRANNPQKTVDGKKYRYKKKSFLVGKVDGKNAYSLPDIMDVIVEPYGYKNNIIGGFNCRHKLVPYTKGSVAPTEYDREELQKQREINAKLREYEREIRRLKRLSIFYKTINPKQSKIYLKQAIKLKEEYIKFANDNGYAWLPYRLEV